MHVLPSLTSPVMAVSVALWCAAAITAIVARSDRNDAARPLAVEASSVPEAVEDKPAIPEATSVHTITYRLTTTFEQRWLRVPLVPSPTPSILAEAHSSLPKPSTLRRPRKSAHVTRASRPATSASGTACTSSISPTGRTI